MAQSDRFINRRILATGGMATVYRAEDVKLGIDVAIKEILIQPSLSERAKGQMESRLRREAKTLARLEHPNIVRCYGLIEDDGAPYILTEFLDGVTLEQEILSHRIVGDKARILNVFRQVCEGLEYARSRQVVHRDMKPGNIFLCHSGQVVIIDFGIARQEDSLGITIDGQILGTPHFMSPEQAAGSRGIDFRSDVFSVGTCLFLAASGSLAFDGPNHFDVENSVRFDPMPRGKVWPELEPVLLRATAKNPDERYQSFNAFAEDISRALDPAPAVVEASATEGVVPVPAEFSQPEPEHPPAALPLHLTHDAPRVVSATPPTYSRPQETHPSTWVTGIAAVSSIALFMSGEDALGIVALLTAAGALATRAGVFGPGAAAAPGGSAQQASAPVARQPIPAAPAAPVIAIVPLTPVPMPAQPAQPRFVKLRLTVNGVPAESIPSPTGMFEIGRDRACHICLPTDDRVSGRHATLALLPQGGLRVTDHSSNGTFVGGRRAISIDIPFGTPIRVGTTDLVVDATFEN